MSNLSFSSWSGGKDSCLALYKAISRNYDVKYLLTMMSERGEGSRSHGINGRLLLEQSRQLNIEIIRKHTSWDDYEKTFLSIIKEFREKGIKNGIFGDIDLQEHLDWIIKVCNIAKIGYYEPLWKNKRTDVVKEFLGSGFKAIIVACDSLKMGEKYLGKDITYKLIDELCSINVDAAGENGEYHTFVYDGPIFKDRVEFIKKDILQKDNYLFLELQ